MKKLLSILLCAVMLFSACAFAEGGELKISNVVINTSDGSMDFSGIDLRLAAAAAENGGGLRIAVDGGGVNALNAVASFDEAGVALAADGLSNSYVVAMEDLMALAGAENMPALTEPEFGEAELAELMAVVEQFGAAVQASMKENGTQEYDGVVYQVYDIQVSEEDCGALVSGICGVLDGIPELSAALLEETGYASLTELIEQEEVRMYMEGEAIGCETDVEADLTAYVSVKSLEEPVAVNNYVYGIIEDDAESGIRTTDVSMSLSAVEDDELTEVLALNGCYSHMIETGEYVGFDGYIVVPEEMGDGEYMDQGVIFGLYGPLATGTGLWQISVADWNDAFYGDIAFGEAEGVVGVYASIMAGEMEISAYVETIEGVGTAGFSAIEGEQGFEVLADIAVTENDGAWLDVDTSNAVNILTITDEQLEKLSGEGMALLLKAVSQLAASNETVMAMMGSMMG